MSSQTEYDDQLYRIVNNNIIQLEQRSGFVSGKYPIDGLQDQKVR